MAQKLRANTTKRSVLGVVPYMPGLPPRSSNPAWAGEGQADRTHLTWFMMVPRQPFPRAGYMLMQLPSPLAKDGALPASYQPVPIKILKTDREDLCLRKFTHVGLALKVPEAKITNLETEKVREARPGQSSSMYDDPHTH